MYRRPDKSTADAKSRLAKEFGNRIANHRKAMKANNGGTISQERLAEIAGLHRTYIGHLERGEVNVTLFSVVRIAGALGVDVTELVDGIDEV